MKHANSLDHKAAEVCLCNIKLKKEMELLSALAGPVHVSKVALEKKSTREYLKIMLQAVAFLAAGGLAFRGHDESSSSSNKGNFLRLLDLLASVSPDFAKQRERCPDNAKYTSPDSQKQLVQSFRHAVDQKIREELGDDLPGAVYSILADETNCVAHKEFLTLVIRYVSATTGEIMERTIKTVHVADTKATTLRDALLSAVKGFGLNPEKCRGQGYDGASNMSGKHNGLAALIKTVCKHAMYAHCCAHRLNLIVEIIGKDVSEYQSVLGFLQQIYNLNSASPKRVAMFENFQHENHVKPTSLSEGGIGKGKNQMQRLKSLSETRWCCRIDAARCCKQHFGAVLKTAHEIKDSPDSTSDQKATALGVVCGVERFSFCFWLDVLIEILSLTDIFNNALQKQRDTLWEAIGLIKATQKKVRELRTDAAFDCVKHSAIEFAAEYGIDVPDFTAPYNHRGTGRRSIKLNSRQQGYTVDAFVESGVGD